MGAKIGAVKIVLTKVDVSSPEQVEEWIQSTVKDFGRLDGAANVAGMAGGDGHTTCATIVSYSIIWGFSRHCHPGRIANFLDRGKLIGTV